MNSRINQLRNLAQLVFGVDLSLLDFVSLKIGDIPEWDSLAHHVLLLEIEKLFSVRFETEDFMKLQSVEDIISKLGNEIV